MNLHWFLAISAVGLTNFESLLYRVILITGVVFTTPFFLDANGRE